MQPRAGDVAASGDHVYRVGRSDPGTSWLEISPRQCAGPITVDPVDAVLPTIPGIDMTVAPNPFRAGGSVAFETMDVSSARIEVFSAGGQHVVTLADRSFAPGTHLLTWNGRDDRGRQMPGGMYFLRLQADRWKLTRKLELLH